MVFGGTAHERLHLSESTVWSGAPSLTDVRPQALQQLPVVRQLLFEGKYVEANAAVQHSMLGQPASFGTSLPLAYLDIETLLRGEVDEYRRWLDLDEAIAHVSFTSGGVRYTREVFASHPAGVLVVRLTCSQRRALHCTVRYGEPHLPGEIFGEGNHSILLKANAWESLHSDGHTGVGCEAKLRVFTEDGTVTRAGNALRIAGASAVTLLISAATTFAGSDPQGRNERLLTTATAMGFSALRSQHVADYRQLYGRVSLDLGEDSAGMHLPIDRRRARLAEDKDAGDEALCALFFQFGRYLTIAASREDSPLPMALQGIWNDGLAAAMGWADDFHLDINTEQNYWLCEAGALPECHAPLAQWLQTLQASGRRTAQREYGAPGWVAHVTSNAWGYSAPGWGLGWSMFVTGGVWIAMQLWRHYRYLDGSTEEAKRFLREQAWPVLRDAACFFLAYLVEYPQKGWMVTGPSISPENAFLAPGTKTACSNSMGPTCDRVLVYALFSACMEASDTLGEEAELRARLKAARDKLPPFQVGKHGQLQEWLFDFEEAYPNHRHTSHLIALYPERQITPEDTPKLARAARITLERRLAQPNWEDTEWSRANLVNYYARLLDGDSAHRQLLGLIAHAADGALLTYSRGGIAGAASNIFAIDGNTAGAAGITEMLLQSEAGKIYLLPALPAAWPRGAVRGLRAYGGITVSMRWFGSSLSKATLYSETAQRCTVVYKGVLRVAQLPAGKVLRVGPGIFA